jgi:hypothetical protein
MSASSNNEATTRLQQVRNRSRCELFSTKWLLKVTRETLSISASYAEATAIRLHSEAHPEYLF